MIPAVAHALFAVVIALYVGVLAVAVSRATRCLRDQIERAERWVKA